MSIANAISLLGGLGFFLFGMTLLGEGLKRVAGSKLEMILGKLTSTTLRGVLLGSLVTAIIQSSSATTVMVVGFVNSGIMKLSNAIGIIMGANIGTTATGWILVLAGVEGGGGFSSATMFALISFIGIILYFFCKKPTQKNIGMIMLAFAVLMSGMQSMSAAMAPLKESAAFLEFISAVSNPFVAIAVGIVVTAIIQSCSASIGILQALSVTGVISYEVAVPMVLGMCIGACAPVLLSALGANINGKRAAFVYLYFNLIGSAVLMSGFYLVHALVGIPFMATTATSMGIAIVNTVYKVAATLLLMPFAGMIEKLAITTIKEKDTDEDLVLEDDLLDERFLDYPAVALEQIAKTVTHMCEVSFGNLTRSLALMESFSEDSFEKVQRMEEKVDRYEDVLGAYIVRLHAKELTEKETRTSGKYLSFLSNIERISDHAVNVAELSGELSAQKKQFSKQALEELKVYSDALREIVGLTKSAVLEADMEKARLVEPLEEVIDMLSKDLKARHIHRVQEGNCTLEMGFMFNDYINNLERVSDHCSNLAVAVLESADSMLQSHTYLRSLKKNNYDEYHTLFESYAEKYRAALPEL